MHLTQQIIPSGTADQLLALYRTIKPDACWKYKYTDVSGITWQNPDNLAFGEMGNIFFASELYRHIQDKDLWKDIEKFIELLEHYCSGNRSRNYSYLYGRSGIASFYIRLSEITGNDLYISRAKALVKQGFEVCSRFGTLNNNAGLATGIAGMLLSCLHLSRNTGYEEFDGIIHRYTEALIGQAIFTDDGIRWNGIVPSKGIETGWAYGSTGVALALAQLASFLQEDRLYDLARHAIHFEDRYDELNGEKEKLVPVAGGYRIGLVNGHVGREIVRLYLDCITGNAAGLQRWQNTATDINSLLESESEKIKLELADGISGWGLACINAYGFTGNPAYLHTAGHVRQIILNRLAETGVDSLPQNGLLNGLAGLGYFMVQLVKPGEPDQLLFPGVVLKKTPATGRRDGPESPSIVVNLNRSMTEKNYKNTLEIPGNRFEKELDGFFSRQELILPRQFKEFVTGLPKDRLDQVTKSSLEVAFNRENFVTQLKKDLVGSPLPGTDSFASKIENTLALPDEQFQQLFLQVSTEMHFLYQEDPIDPRQPLSPQQIFHLLTDYGSKSFFYRLNEFNMLVEDTMGILRLFVDMLTNGGIVKNVLNALSEIVMSQPPPVLSLIMQKFGVGEPLALEEVLRRQALEYIRGGLMMGILDVTPQKKITIQRSDISSLQAAN